MLKTACLIAMFMLCSEFGDTQTNSFRGTVVYMEMSQCTQDHGFVSAMSGQKVVTSRACPEYTVMTDKVAYIVVGLKTNQFMPLAEDVTFFINDGDVTVSYQGGKNPSHFKLRRMILRADWERVVRIHKVSPCSGAGQQGDLFQTAEE